MEFRTGTPGRCITNGEVVGLPRNRATMSLIV
jgi:hypothetical protein